MMMLRKRLSRVAAPGKWRTEPYQREVMDAFTDNHVEKIIMMFGSQIGKTEMMLNMMAQKIQCEKQGEIVIK